MLPNKAVWGQPLPLHLYGHTTILKQDHSLYLHYCFLFYFQVAHVLDPNSDLKKHIVSVGSTMLMRSDLLSLGSSQDVEATVKMC